MEDLLTALSDVSIESDRALVGEERSERHLGLLNYESDDGRPRILRSLLQEKLLELQCGGSVAFVTSVECLRRKPTPAAARDALAIKTTEQVLGSPRSSG